MAAADEFTFDIDLADGGARRPSLEDIGGAVLEDDDDYPPPNDNSELYAAMGNQWQRQLAGLARMIPVARITVEYSAGTPFISQLQVMSETLVIADFTVTDNGAGDVSIEWEAGALPTPTCKPTGATNNGSGDTSIDFERVSATEIRIRTKLAGVAADVPFTVEIH